MGSGINVGAALGQGAIIDDSEQGRRKAEIDASLRCGGCGVRIVTGFEFTVATCLRQKGDLSGRRVTAVEHIYTCQGHDGCGAVLDLAGRATAVRPVEGEFLFLDDPRVVALLTNQHARLNPDGTPAAEETPPAEQVPAAEPEPDPEPEAAADAEPSA